MYFIIRNRTKKALDAGFIDNKSANMFVRRMVVGEATESTDPTERCLAIEHISSRDYKVVESTMGLKFGTEAIKEKWARYEQVEADYNKMRVEMDLCLMNCIKDLPLHKPVEEKPVREQYRLGASWECADSEKYSKLPIRETKVSTYYQRNKDTRSGRAKIIDSLKMAQARKQWLGDK